MPPIKHVLILSSPDDTHANAVEWALRSKGCDVSRFSFEDFPAISHHILMPSHGTFVSKTADRCFTLSSKYDAVWVRRHGAPSISEMDVHENDRIFVDKTLREYTKSLLMWLESIIPPYATRWVNSLYGRMRAESKPLQLNLANRIGFRVPETLVSNCKDEVYKFHKIHGRIVCKGLVTHTWANDDIRAIETSLITDHDFDYPNNAFKMQPAIYQKAIDKHVDIRLTIFGEFVFSTSLRPHESTHELTDWRGLYHGGGVIEPYILDKEIVDKARKLMAELGIVFAAIDLCIDIENGDVIFLEVNEAGQFLFQEEIVPEFPILDAFTHFLLSNSSESWATAPTRLTLESARP